MLQKHPVLFTLILLFALFQLQLFQRAYKLGKFPRVPTINWGRSKRETGCDYKIKHYSVFKWLIFIWKHPFLDLSAKSHAWEKMSDMSPKSIMYIIWYTFSLFLDSFYMCNNDNKKKHSNFCQQFLSPPRDRSICCVIWTMHQMNQNVFLPNYHCGLPWSLRVDPTQTQQERD